MSPITPLNADSSASDHLKQGDPTPMATPRSLSVANALHTARPLHDSAMHAHAPDSTTADLDADFWRISQRVSGGNLGVSSLVAQSWGNQSVGEILGFATAVLPSNQHDRVSMKEPQPRADALFSQPPLLFTVLVGGSLTNSGSAARTVLPVCGAC